MLILGALSLSFCCCTALLFHFLYFFFLTHFHVRQYADGFTFDIAQQSFEQAKGFAFVLLFRVFLTIATQVNTLTQVIHRGQMLFPQVVEYLQHNLLLEHTQGFAARCGFFLFVGFLNLFQNTLTQSFFVQFVFVIQPLLNRQFDIKFGFQVFLKTFNIPLLGKALWWNKVINGFVNNVSTDSSNGFRDILFRHQLITLPVNRTTLIVGNVIVFQQLLTDIEVTAFHFTLCFFNSVSHHAVLDGFAIFHTHCLHHAAHTLRHKDAHQVVFQRQEETGRTRVTLTAGTTTQLVIDTAGFMTLGTDDMKTTVFQYLIMALLPVCLNRGNLFFRRIFQSSHFGFPVTAQHNVGTTTGHVGGDGHSSGATCVSNNLCFAGVLFGVQYVVLNLGFGQLLRQILRCFNRSSTHQNRTLLRSYFADFFDDRVVFFFLSGVDHIVVIDTAYLFVGRDNHHIQVIDLHKLEGFGIGSTCHTTQLFIQTEIVLEGGRSQCLALCLNLNAFFGFHCLMQTLAPATTRHGTAGMFVNDHDLTILHDVIDVFLVHSVSFQSRVHVVQQIQVSR